MKNTDLGVADGKNPFFPSRKETDTKKNQRGSAFAASKAPSTTQYSPSTTSASSGNTGSGSILGGPTNSGGQAKGGANQVQERKDSANTSKGTVVKETIPAPLAPEPSLAQAQFLNDGRVVASPRAKKLASQMGVDLATVRGSGPHGRIQAEDVQSAKGQPISVPWIAESNAPAKIASEIPRIEKKSIDSDKPPAAGKSF